MRHCSSFIDHRSWLSFDDADGPHAGYLLREARLVDHFHHVINVLVSAGLFFREALAALSAGDDSFSLEFLVDAAPRGFLDGGGATQGPASPMTRRPESSLHAARPADQHPAGPSHVP